MNKILRALVLSFMLLLTVGCGTVSNDEGKNLSLTVGLMPDTDSVPFIVAKEKGYFAEEGVDVELVPFKSAQERDSALQSGQLDGAVSDLLALCFFKDGGFDVTVTSSTDGSYKLIAKKDGAVNAAELFGGDVAISKNTIIEYVTDQILTNEEMRSNDINKIIIPQIPIRLEMLQNGKIDAATLPEPMATLAIESGGVNIVSSDELGINPGIVVMTKNTVTERKAAVQAMYRAYNKAVNYINTAPREEYIDMVVEKSGFPSAAHEQLVMPHYREATMPTEQDVAEVVTWLTEKHLINEPYKYNDIVTDILP